ncbi:unnamed protein product [Allacma fusca]|uniref:phenylalanine--tRNA ligase n=1 Tax=Allacma fusca TaxID=39272 RepID=A0A8J2LMP2_9HEXA|nr:unnamed protein product [Allacma fusca]
MQKPLTERILAYLEALEASGSVSSLKLAQEFKEDHQKVIGAIKSLQSLGSVIQTEQDSINTLQVTAEGNLIIENGSHEVVIYKKTPETGSIPLADLLSSVSETVGKVGLSKAVQLKWIKVESNAVSRVVTSVVDTIQQTLKEISAGSSNATEETLGDLRRRKLISASAQTYLIIRRGQDFTLNIEKLETELTLDILNDPDYEKKVFKPYNFNALGQPVKAGHLHPLLKVRAEFISILTEMGFSEMPTNRFVESSFWNFDALFVPQMHPARDVQDTFFMSVPANCNKVPGDYMEKVKKVHMDGDYGSLGYKTDWKEAEAFKNVLRTHTTAVSARVLHELGQQETFQPVKRFSIDRVFRNETLDATHLAEFHQVEGFVADRNLSLGHLIGVMREFFRRLGIDQLRFKPAFNPYTEPSMEVFAFHKGLKKWVEVGNSGVFRPEMLLPMNLPSDVRIIAWGLSLERPTMIRYGIDNIRSLVGPKVDLQMVYDNALCRLDKQ